MNLYRNNNIRKLIGIYLTTICFLEKARENLTLKQIERSREYKTAENIFKKALADQIRDISTPAKIKQIIESTNTVEVMVNNFKRLDEYIPREQFKIILIWAGEKGGQKMINSIIANTFKQKMSKKAPNALPKFDLKNDELLNILDSRVNFIIQSVDNTTLDKIILRINAGVAEGKTFTEISKMIEKDIPDMTLARAERIVRTEVNHASNLVELYTEQQNGIQQHKWIHSRDQRVSVECRANARQGAITVGQPFASGVIYPPQHPNCRCFLAPVIDESFDIETVIDNIWAGE